MKLPSLASRWCDSKKVVSNAWCPWQPSSPGMSFTTMQYSVASGSSGSAQPASVKGCAIFFQWSSRSSAGWIGQKLGSIGEAASSCSPGLHGVEQMSATSSSQSASASVSAQSPTKMLASDLSSSWNDAESAFSVHCMWHSACGVSAEQYSGNSASSPRHRFLGK